MTETIRVAVIVSILAGTPVAASFAQHPAMPPGVTHEEHLAEMKRDSDLKKRGAAAMGFDQDKTTHHFRLYPTGGAIEVEVNDPADDASRNEIRMHLQEIAGEFASGNFGKPFATHGEIPPGVSVLQKRKSAISFLYEDTREGGRVRITTSDSKARSALHEFLRYQIGEHATGDPLTVQGVG